jgi:hypothetical protein
MALKRCTGCDGEFPATREHFHRDRTKPDGWSTRCKACKKRVAPTQEERFWAKVDIGHGCWDWTAATRPGGHGVFFTGGGHKIGRLVFAHRFAYELVNGPIPPGAHVLHKCDNAPCVRPDHLELGDHAKNMADAAARLRMRRGHEHGMARLTENEVLKIRELSARGWSRGKIGRRLGLPRSTVQAIVERRTWSWL